MLRCYLEMDQPHTASMLVQGLMQKDPDLAPELVKYQVESAWQLSQWEAVETSCEGSESSDWSVNLGRILLKAQHQDYEGKQST
jgi:hypothetical protein